MQVEPYAEMFTDIDAQLQGGKAPDIFRCDYQDLGLYSGTGQLLDLSPYLSASDAAEFHPAFWAAVNYGGTPYAVPHQTDTTAVIYRKDMFAAAGITSVPDSLASAWTWDEFQDLALRLKKKLPAGTYPFSYDWQYTGAYRWLTWLFAAGGELLTKDLTATALPSAPALKAMAFTKGFFEQGLVPANSSIKSYGYPDSLFEASTVSMAFAGDFLLSGIADTFKDAQWGATFQPVDVAAATDLGGNALAATRHCSNPELAAEFLRFMVTRENQKYFCENATELPTRLDLLHSKLDYTTRPDLMPVYLAQAATLTSAMTAQTAVPAFGRINSMLQTELENAFVGGQSAEATIQHIATGTTAALAG